MIAWIGSSPSVRISGRERMDEADEIVINPSSSSPGGARVIFQFNSLGPPFLLFVIFNATDVSEKAAGDSSICGTKYIIIYESFRNHDAPEDVQITHVACTNAPPYQHECWVLNSVLVTSRECFFSFSAWMRGNHPRFPKFNNQSINPLIRAQGHLPLCLSPY